MMNEQKTGSFVFEDGIYEVKGNSRYSLDSNKFENADGSIYKEGTTVGYFNTYKDGISGDLKANLSNVDLVVFAEVTTLVAACLAAIDNHYNA